MTKISDILFLLFKLIPTWCVYVPFGPKNTTVLKGSMKTSEQMTFFPLHYTSIYTAPHLGSHSDRPASFEAHFHRSTSYGTQALVYQNSFNLHT